MTKYLTQEKVREKNKITEKCIDIAKVNSREGIVYGFYITKQFFIYNLNSRQLLHPPLDDLYVFAFEIHHGTLYLSSPNVITKISLEECQKSTLNIIPDIVFQIKSSEDIFMQTLYSLYLV